MSAITEIDPNLKQASLDGVNLRFHAVDQPPFMLSGLPWFAEEGRFCRLPQAALPQASSGVQTLAAHMTGVAVRFQTDATTIGVRAVLGDAEDMSVMARSGSSGFDLYEGVGPGKVFRANTMAARGAAEVAGLLVRHESRQLREWTLYFPLYKGVVSLAIGLDPDGVVVPPTSYAGEKPVLFYGSSITHGGCASRPGNSYPAIICRRLDAPLINWGFAGNCMGELAMAKIIGSLDLGAFVFDYDHNAPSPEHLAATHRQFFKTVRASQPLLPIIMVSRPDFKNREEDRSRRAIIRATYEEAQMAGDEQVYFVDGETLFGTTDRDMCTVDGCHPNDLGFLRMADAILPAVRSALQIM